MPSVRFIWTFAFIALSVLSVARGDGQVPPESEIPAATSPVAPAGGTTRIVRRALLVGIDTYEPTRPGSSLAPPPGRGFRNLRGAARDAQALAEVLVDRFGFLRDNVVVFTDQAAGRAAILKLKRPSLFLRRGRYLRPSGFYEISFQSRKQHSIMSLWLTKNGPWK